MKSASQLFATSSSTDRPHRLSPDSVVGVPHNLWKSFVVSFFIVAAWAIGWYLNGRIDWQVRLYLVVPLLWAATVCIVVRTFSFSAFAEWKQTRLVPIAVGFVAVYLVIMLALGTLAGFGRSPYQHNWESAIGHFWAVLSVLAATELVRWVLATSLASRMSETTAIGVTWPLLTLTSVSITSLQRLTTVPDTFEVIGRIILPSAAISLLATYLVLRGGPLASVAFLAPLLLFERFSPILPDPSWALAALVGVMVPIVFLGALDNYLAVAPNGVQREDTGPDWWSIGVGTVIVVVVWLNLGVFGVRPTVVHGQSMEPTYQTGDVVISRDVQTSDIIVGDIIVFRLGSIDVVHRVIDILPSDDGPVFITQGDNNAAPDGPVMEDSVVGRVDMRIPKAGQPAVQLKRALAAIAN